ncbi:MAG: sugar ABC transporter ATP-binding protein [Paenibacillaceae bacterium]
MSVTNIVNCEVVVEAAHITKVFGVNKVLDDVSISLKRGEIHCLCGENGAGKSTLIKILSGAYQPDGGEIYIDGIMCDTLTPLLVKQKGIEVIHQEIILVNELSVAENIFPDFKFRKYGFYSFEKTCEAARELMDQLGINLNPKQLVEKLSAADQQFVKILKAMAPSPKVLILDEPTAMFNMNDTQMVLNLVKNISQKGIAIIYISHHLLEVQSIADTVSVLRDGKLVSRYDNSKKDIDLDKLTTDMVGRPVNMFYKRESSHAGKELLKISGLKLTENSPTLNFSLNKGEILGITGMVGSGRSEIIRAIYGLDKRNAGDIQLDGQSIRINSPADAIKLGMGFISEDRQKSGLVLSMSILMNTTFVRLPKRGSLINLQKEVEIARDYVDKLDIKTDGIDKITGMLSGGNQQKVIIAKWLHKGFDILFLDEPTKGIDVNAKFEIYKLLHKLVTEGKSLIIVSSDMPEVVSLCDRVLIVCDGDIKGELWGQDITEDNIIKISLEVS